MARGTRRVKPRFWLLMMGVMLAVFVWLYSVQETLLTNQRALITELRSTADQMNVAIADSERKLEFAKSDEYVIRMARSSLGLVMPDEVLYVSSN